jgi:hypothetical protein
VDEMSTTRVWEVLDTQDLFTMHITLSEETAKYLRDWCEAVEIELGTGKNFDIFQGEAFE